MLNPDTVSRDTQRARALTAANRKRTAAAQLKRQLRQRTVTLDQLLAAPPEAIRSQMALDVLGWAPGMGRTRLEILNVRGARSGQVNLAKPLGQLTDRQRAWLADQLAGR